MKFVAIIVLVLGNVYLASSFPSSNNCPDQCHCVEVSHDAPENLQEYMHKYDWVEGMNALGCWGRNKIPNVPEELKQDVNYVLLIGSKKAKKSTSEYQGDQPLYGPAISLVRSEVTAGRKNSQLRSIPANSFRGMSHLIQLDISDNKLKQIRGDAFEGLQSLRVLTLSRNRVKNLPAGVFQNLTSVVALDISENRLRGIGGTTFYNLKNLKQLSVNDNLVSRLSGSAFDTLQNLEILNLANNRIREIPSELFNDLQKLRTLNMDGNRLRLLSYEFFSGMSSLEILSLKGNRISEISHYVFYYAPNLKQLDLSHNNLKEIEQTMFWSQKQLSALDLSDNNISQIGDLAFQHATNLAQVNMDNNKLSKLTALKFSGLKSLQTLKLSGNNISALDVDTFKDLASLVSLSLSNNKLQKLERGLLFGLRELSALYLDGNRLSNIDGEELKTTPSSFDSKVQWVYLRNNNLKSLGPNVFSEIPFVNLLDLSYNDIEDIDMDAFGPKPNLQTLLLNNNKLSDFDDGRLRTMQNLATLNAAHNQINKISRGAFTGLESIKDLNLEGNKLDSISSTVLYDIHSVEELNLNNNYLVHLPTELFTSMHNLKVLLMANNKINTLTMPLYPQVLLERLDLSGNELDRIRGYITVALKHDAKLGLSGNLWNCDCNIKNILNINENPDSRIQLTNTDDLLCTAPRHLKGSKVMDLEESDVTCEAETIRPKPNARVNFPPNPLPDRRPAPPSPRLQVTTAPRIQRVEKEREALKSPWHALLWDSEDQNLLCHGALVGDQWVLTTKSCFDGEFLVYDWWPLNPSNPSSDWVLYPNDIVVRLGKSEDLVGFEATEQTYGISRVIAPASAFDFDVIVSGRDSPVLIELRAHVSVDENVRPISLELGGFYRSSYRSTGKTENAMTFWAADKNSRTRKDELRFARIEAVSCISSNDRYSLCGTSDDTESSLVPSVAENIGAPMITREGANAWQLKGIKAKQNEGSNEVFLKLREYTDWLFRRVQL
ncbi:insulin-like growth factor-binding protein complex acid labile subunit [Ptychodera flava]|uniref:insulin-like growth factor-binding protein complex acid labile subunit n=1 Tax=Ptychodera flava TaxID=63121 RepID=UPI00396A7CB4